jgi:predicted O-methyltransferase YrrM
MTTGANQPHADDAGYEFTTRWFEQYMAVWDHLIPQLGPKKVIEVGSYEGRSACYLIEKCAVGGSMEIYCIDTWQGGVEHDKAEMGAVELRFDKNIQTARRKAKGTVTVRKLKGRSSLALSEIIAAEKSATFDLIYIDGSHRAPDVLTDSVLAFQLLRIDGLMIFDDYLWHMEPVGKQDPLNMPKPAIDAFLNIFQRKMRIVYGAPLGQLYAMKVSD